MVQKLDMLTWKFGNRPKIFGWMTNFSIGQSVHLTAVRNFVIGWSQINRQKYIYRNLKDGVVAENCLPPITLTLPAISIFFLYILIKL